MYHGVVPDVLPIAPRPLQGELRSSWLLRVASANALTLRELMDAVAARHPGAGTDDAFLDDGLPARVAGALAQFTRLPESVVHGLDLTDQLPGCPGDWVRPAPALEVGGHDQVSDQRAAYTFCPSCLDSVAPVAAPPHLPVEWACAVVTHCPIHRTRLLEWCPGCHAHDPFVIGIGEQFGRAECWQCEASLGFAAWPSDAWALEPVLQLQTAVISAVRDQPSALASIDSANVRISTSLVAELLDLLVDEDDDDSVPVYTRVAAVHWPAELCGIGRRIPESRFAYLPVHVRFLAMACAASVINDTAAVLAGPRRTLVASLDDHEWRRWQQHMEHWPTRMRDTVSAARTGVGR